MASKKKLDSGGFSIPQRPKPAPVSHVAESNFVIPQRPKAAPVSQDAEGDLATHHSPASEDKSKTRKSGAAVSAKTAASESAKMPGSRGPRGGGTIQLPYVRTDGVETRSTTIHLPVDVHKRLRRHCFDKGVSMSHFVTAAIEAELKRGSD